MGFHPLDLLLVYFVHHHFGFRWNKTLVDRFGYRFVNRALPSDSTGIFLVDSFLRNANGIARNLLIWSGNVRPLTVQHRMRRPSLSHHASYPALKFTNFGPLHPDTVYRDTLDWIDTLCNRGPYDADPGCSNGSYPQSSAMLDGGMFVVECPDSSCLTVPAAVHLVVKLDHDTVAMTRSLFCGENLLSQPLRNRRTQITD